MKNLISRLNNSQESFDELSSMSGFLITGKKTECYGCEACAQICPKSAIEIRSDEYGFRYPFVDLHKCISCGLCNKVCPCEKITQKNPFIKVYGGYLKNYEIREISSSGGAFFGLVKAFFKIEKNQRHLVFGVVADGLMVSHQEADSVEEAKQFCSSKYIQSNVKESYKIIGDFLLSNCLVLFTGTPCQVSGLINYLDIVQVNRKNLYTIETLCAGVATPILYEKYNEYLFEMYGAYIKEYNWRYKDKKRWDFNCCHFTLENGECKTIDRWFSGCWYLFTQRLLMRPSCECCKLKGIDRVSDISLGDFWGVDREYPELYDDNRGTSLILCNTEKGLNFYQGANEFMISREVEFERARKYQTASIVGKPFHVGYKEFMDDLLKMNYKQLCKKWVKKPSIKLLLKKYVFSNYNRYVIWKLKQRFKCK